jgi:hypothetical protein
MAGDTVKLDIFDAEAAGARSAFVSPIREMGLTEIGSAVQNVYVKYPTLERQ